MVNKQATFFYLIKCLLIVLIWLYNKGAFSAQASLAQVNKAPVQLAQVYQQEDIKRYLVSEKYDGIRAIWKDQQLRTRSGKQINAPAWFTEKLPNVWLDGELWYKRGEFEFVASTVSKHTPIDSQWQHIKYMVFDAPNNAQPFGQRARNYTTLINELKLSHIQPVTQFRVSSTAALMDLLNQYTAKGAEGLMLQKEQALFIGGRNSNLLKLKQYMDAEATVIKHLPGKGKYKGKMGALLVEYISDEGRTFRFKIGSGFSDKERAKPPAIGARITFAYHGFTKRGIPRFASFIRVRPSD